MELHEYIKQVYEAADGDLFAISLQIESDFKRNDATASELGQMFNYSPNDAAKYVADTYQTLTFYPRCEGCKGGHDKCCRTE